jgi:4-amino-4-deoxy-L-arabinose transferase-like glycosyltransferase
MNGKSVNSMNMAAARELFKSRFDFFILALLLGAFLLVAVQRLGTVPVPETDEAYTLQVGYEMVNHGQLALPMYRYLGGNIENVWHSYTPLYFAILHANFKLFGWGLLQGRAFNLFTAALVLLMTYLIGRRWFNWRVAMVAVVLLLSDQTFFERSRMLRNDFAAAAFAMLAFYLYEIAAEKKRGGYYIAAGLAAGAGVMCHTNTLYMLGAIGLLMLLGRGWRVIKERRLYQFTLAALAVMAYEIVYDIIDYKNFVLQNRADDLHFGLFERWGWLRNIADEGKRYLRWAAGSADFTNVSRATLRVFQLLTMAAIIYLLVITVRRIKRGDWLQRAATRLIIVTLFAIIFHAVIVSHKEIYYIAHLAPWFALCVGVMLIDGLDGLRRIKLPLWLPAPRRVAIIVVALAMVAFGFQLVREYRGYVRVLRDPEQASFEDFKSVLRRVVPDGVCPVAMKAPVMWLAFPETDRCFATIEKRMLENIDIAGNEYAVLLPADSHKNRIEAAKELNANYPLLAELHDTPYGDVRVYYTGTNSQWRALPVQQYYFFRNRRGQVSAEQVARGRIAWAYEFTELGKSVVELGLLVDDHGGSLPPDRQDETINFRNIELKPGEIYQLSLDAIATASRWELRVVDAETGTVLHHELIGQQPEAQHIEGLFKSVTANRVRLVVQRLGRQTPDPLRILRIAIREIPPA